MSCHYDQVRPLPHGRSSHPRRHSRPARAIPHHHDLAEPGPWRVLGVALVAIATALVTGAMLFEVLRSQGHVLDRLLPGWPWW